MKYLTMIIALTFGLTAGAQEYTWKTDRMDGSRTGCKSPSENNVEECLGKIARRGYEAPNGKVFPRRSATGRIAECVIQAQPKMAKVKKVIGYAPEEIYVDYPESPLSNWFIDRIMESAEKFSGKKVHIGVGNFGGIRVDRISGNIIMDDILSMFPFRNQIVYLEHKGSTLKKLLDEMAADHFHVLGGVQVIAEDGRIVSALIDGKPIEDDKVYGVATISFLLNGGDGLHMAKDAANIIRSKEDIKVFMLNYINEQTALGRPITGSCDGRVVIR